MAIYRDTTLLHPKFRRICEGLAQDLIRRYEAGETKTRFEIFETFRSPERQMDLLRKGATKASMFQSAHNFGLACDFVAVIDHQTAHNLGDKTGEKVLAGWSWHADNDWRFLRIRAEAFGLRIPIDWDLGHVESPYWQQVKSYLR